MKFVFLGNIFAIVFFLKYRLKQVAEAKSQDYIPCILIMWKIILNLNCQVMFTPQLLCNVYSSLRKVTTAPQLSKLPPNRSPFTWNVHNHKKQLSFKQSCSLFICIVWWTSVTAFQVYRKWRNNISPHFADVVILNVLVVAVLFSFLKRGIKGKVVQQKRPHLRSNHRIKSTEKYRLKQVAEVKSQDYTMYFINVENSCGNTS